MTDHGYVVGRARGVTTHLLVATDLWHGETWPIGLCHRANKDRALGLGVHHFTSNRANITCTECTEWMHA